MIKDDFFTVAKVVTNNEAVETDIDFYPIVDDGNVLESKAEEPSEAIDKIEIIELSKNQLVFRNQDGNNEVIVTLEKN